MISSNEACATSVEAAWCHWIMFRFFYIFKRNLKIGTSCVGILYLVSALLLRAITWLSKEPKY